MCACTCIDKLQFTPTSVYEKWSEAWKQGGGFFLEQKRQRLYTQIHNPAHLQLLYASGSFLEFRSVKIKSSLQRNTNESYYSIVR